MNKEEKDIFDFVNSISDEEKIELLNGIVPVEDSICDIQRKRIKSKVIDELKNSHTKKRSKLRSGLVAAGISGVVMLTAISPLGKKAMAEIAEKLYFIPGLGKATENKGQDIFILAHLINFPNGERTITVNSVTKEGKSMEIEMSGNGSLGGYQSLSIVDEKGNKYVSSQSYTAVGHGWLGGYSFTDIPEQVNNFKIILSDNIEIPITLKKAESYIDYSSMGPTDIKNNFGITLVSSNIEDKIKFELIQHPAEDKQVIYYGKSDKEGHNLINILIKDENGQLYSLEHAKSYAGTLSEFYFKPDSNERKYIVEIPEVTLKYDVDREITLPMPKEGETAVDKNINMNGFNMKIARISREGNKVRVYVDTNYDNNKTENVSVATLDMQELSLDWYRYQFNDDITTEYYEFDINPKDKKLRLKFKEMYTILKGPWKFELTNK